MRCLLALIVCLAFTTVAHAQHGVYFDYHNPDAENPKHINHPHVDGVLLRFSWKELEPQKGQYDFEPIERMIAPWAATNRRILLGIKPAGQRNEDTPDWLYDDVPAITYERNGIQVKVPKYWHRLYDDMHKGLIFQLGQRYNFDDRIEGIMVGIGHLGFITACPNKDGSFAFLEAGWTPNKWKNHAARITALYQQHLPRKNLFLNGSDLVLKIKDPPAEGFGKSERYFIDVRDDILNNAVFNEKVSIASNGLHADVETFLATGLPGLLESYQEPALSRDVFLAVHDDWPLWVPAGQREGVNADKDNAYFIHALQNAIGCIDGIPRTNVSWIKLLDTDLECTDPDHENYQLECEAALIGFKNALLK